MLGKTLHFDLLTDLRAFKGVIGIVSERLVLFVCHHIKSVIIIKERNEKLILARSEKLKVVFHDSLLKSLEEKR